MKRFFWLSLALSILVFAAPVAGSVPLDCHDHEEHPEDCSLCLLSATPMAAAATVPTGIPSAERSRYLGPAEPNLSDSVSLRAYGERAPPVQHT